MIGIIGMGNEGFALYSFLSSKGYNVLGYSRNYQNLGITKIFSRDKIEGTFDFSVTNDLVLLLKKCDIIFVTIVTNYYEDLASGIVKICRDFDIDISEKLFVLFSGKLGGCLVFNNIFLQSNLITNIVETDALFACRKISNDTVWVRGIKKWNLLISNKDYFYGDKSLGFYNLVKDIFKGIDLEVADNFIQRGLTDFGAMAHAPISLINMANIDSKRDLLFYMDGITENTVKLIEGVYQDFNSVASRFNTFIINPCELLDRYYGTVKSSLIEAIRNVPNYKYTKMPDSLFSRFLYEDVSNTLYPLVLIASRFGVELKVIPSIVNLISFVLDIDLSCCGRTLDKMGLKLEEIV